MIAALFALLAAGGDAAVAPPSLPLERVVALAVHPPQATLDGRFELAQLVVRGQLDDGQWIDCTRACTATVDADVAAVDARARVRPLRDGSATLTVRVGERTATLPVVVRGVAAPPHPSFVNDVEPLFTRLGCNAGTCHGSAKGRNGFKFSLRGYDPVFDHEALTDELAGRRFNRAVPEQSLFLLKPTASVPHEGGKRLEPGSREYQLLVDWVAAGAPLDEAAPRITAIELHPQDPVVPLPGMRQQFAVRATYADGRVRDVTSEAAIESNDLEVATADAEAGVTALRRGDVAILARYGGRFVATRMIVMGDRNGFDAAIAQRPPAPRRNWIDELVESKLAAVKASASGPCSDAEFVRRLHLDLTGAPPTVREARAFLLDRRPSQVKRDELVERLIGSVEFVEHWTNKWADLLQVNSKFLGSEGATRLRDWIREQIASNRPYDQFAAAILGASGSTFANPPAAYWKILRAPDVAMENTTQLFLGVRFSCNKCHDHPFERWTQDQHWQLAAFFAQVARENVPGSPMMPRTYDNRPDEVDLAYEEMVKDVGTGDVMHPNRNVAMAPAFPYEFAPAARDGAADGTVDVPGGGAVTRRDRLVRWITAAENPYFAKSYVNRIWSYFLGVGLIEPVDDLRASNPPTNPELLDRLTATFVESGFDVRALMRLICTSATYQRSLMTDEWNADDTLHYAHATARRLPAETLFDAIQLATGRRPQVSGARPDARAAEYLDPSVATADGFLALFGRPPRESACECERGSGLSLGQALHLVNGPTLSEAIDDPQSDLTRMVAFERDPRKLIDELYLRFLSRPASEPEFAALAPGFEPNQPANVAALPPALLEQYRARRAAWEATIPRANWQVIDTVEAQSAGGATWTKQPDGSLLASGVRPATDTTTLLAWTRLEKITALRIEAIADPSLPAGGSGRSDSGNFVVGELKLVAVPLAGGSGGRSIALQNGSADFSQQQFDPNAIADGNGKTGWAIWPNVMQRHQAVWEFGEDVGGPGGTLLVLTLDQGWGDGHNLGRFRLSLASDPRPVRAAAFPDEVLAALTQTTDQRAPAAEATLHRTFLATAPDLREAMRLAAAQDVAWALATSPAFLFNR